jgi:uncharacterized Tic20 family protein
MVLDAIGEIFFFGILAIPLISWLILRKKDHFSGKEKFLLGLAISFLLSLLFFFISIGILLRDGLGPG